jgi:hypothetical protein
MRSDHDVLMTRRSRCADCSALRHMFQERREGVMAIEAAVVPLMLIPKALAA